MGFFSKLLGRDLKSNSINIVMNLLQHQVEHGLMDANPRQVAIELINNVWSKSPDIFEGRFGQLPFKLTVAIYSLVKGYELYPQGGTKMAILMSIRNVYDEIQVNGNKYPLNGLDRELLKEVDMINSRIVQEFQSDSLYKEMIKFNNDTEKQELIDELNIYFEELKSKTDEQVAVRLAFALIIRDGLANQYSYTLEVLDGVVQNNDEQIINIIQKLSLLFKYYEGQGRTALANATILWIMTLKSYNFPEALSISSNIWQYLQEKEFLLTEIFNNLKEDGINISEQLIKSKNYIPKILI